MRIRWFWLIPVFVLAPVLAWAAITATTTLSGTIDTSQLTATGVTAGTYTCPQVTVNSAGQITAISNGSCGSAATSLNTHAATGNSGLDIFTATMDAHDAALAAWPISAPLPINPSGSVPFSLSIGGDMFAGDLYCLAETDYLTVFPGANGCIYGKAVHGDRIGPIIYQSNKDINADGGIGGPGIVEWADRPNIDGSGNQGYMDIWAWGNGSSDYSNSISLGNRDSTGAGHRRFRIRNNGQVQLPDMSGTGNAPACFDANGDFYRGTSAGC